MRKRVCHSVLPLCIRLSNDNPIEFPIFARIFHAIKAETNRYTNIKNRTKVKKYAKIIAIALLIATCFMTPVMAQRKVMNYLPKYEQEPYHFGFLLGFNEMMYTIKTVDNYQNLQFSPSTWPMGPVSGETTQSISVYNIESDIMPGFTVGIIGSKRLGKYFDLRLIPTLSFADRNISYTIAIKDKNGSMRFDTINNKPIFTTFVEFPLHIKYRSKRFNNVGLCGTVPQYDESIS